jgi:hypothetical protein
MSYTLSWARGTSSYAEDIFYRYYQENPDTSFVPPTEVYDLDFDQRHRIFVQGIASLPLGITAYIFGYIGNGFPYTPPGPEGKYDEINISRLPFQKNIDCVLSKSMSFSKLKINLIFEIVNIFDYRYEIAPHGTFMPLDEINRSDFNDYLDCKNSYYGPPADINHDGLIVPAEEFRAFYDLVKTTDDWVNANSPPRRARIGVTLTFN